MRRWWWWWWRGSRDKFFFAIIFLLFCILRLEEIKKTLLFAFSHLKLLNFSFSQLFICNYNFFCIIINTQQQVSLFCRLSFVCVACVCLLRMFIHDVHLFNDNFSLPSIHSFGTFFFLSSVLERLPFASFIFTIINLIFTAYTHINFYCNIFQYILLDLFFFFLVSFLTFVFGDKIWFFLFLFGNHIFSFFLLHLTHSHWNRNKKIKWNENWREIRKKFF